ncbi:unnamed protein product [Aphanomyces euteiches]
MPHFNHEAFTSSYKMTKPTKDDTVNGPSCPTCTFINKPGSALCAMCEQFIGPPAHAIHSDGSWSCGSCDHHNENGMRECYYCDAPYVSAVASSVPLNIFCSRCGVRNVGTAGTCVACDHTLISKFESIKHELSDTTNFVARDLGLHVKVKCPGCMKVCNVPSSACFRCGSCQVYFAAPSVGDVTSFHVSRLTRSLSTSVMNLFQKKKDAPENTYKSQPPRKGLASSFLDFFREESSDSESDDESLLFGPAHDASSPVRPLRTSTTTSTPPSEPSIPIGIRIPAPGEKPMTSSLTSSGASSVAEVTPPTQQQPAREWKPIPNRNYGFNHNDLPPPLTPLRKSKSVPVSMHSFEREWDLRQQGDGLSSSMVFVTSDDEEKEELQDQDILDSLRLSSSSSSSMKRGSYGGNNGFHVPNAETIEF